MKSNFLKIRRFGLVALASFFFGQAASAGTIDLILSGFTKTGANAGYPVQEFVPAWIIYLNGFLTIMGLLFTIMIIWAGYLWFTAHGKEEQVTRAKNLLINAAIGLGIIIGGRLIVELALNVLGTTLTTK
jgi:hypothetical protein